MRNPRLTAAEVQTAIANAGRRVALAAPSANSASSAAPSDANGSAPPSASSSERSACASEPIALAARPMQLATIAKLACSAPITPSPRKRASPTSFTNATSSATSAAQNPTRIVTDTLPNADESHGSS